MNKKINNEKVNLKIDERFYLRTWYEKDILDLHEMLSVEGVGENLGFSHSESIETTKSKLNSYIEERCNFAIIDSKNGKAIGSLGLEKYTPKELLVTFDKHYGRELYGYVSPKYWGNRIMTKSIYQVLKYGFEVEDLDFIIAGHFYDNDKSKRMIKRFGFTYTNTIDFETKYGKTVKTLLYILWKEDFIKYQLEKSIDNL